MFTGKIKKILMELFDLTHGIIVACDVKTLDELKRIVEATSDLEGITGYKPGFMLGLKHGLPDVVDVIRDYSDMPIIYDHQKAGTDIPESGIEFAAVMKSAGIESAIIFPQAGPATEIAFITALIDAGIVPMVGGEMTHKQYLKKDGGYIDDSAPEEMYKNGAKAGAEFFIVPGNKPDSIKKYDEMLKDNNHSFCMPGIGRQGGDIKSAFDACECNAYAIIGSSIIKASDVRAAAKSFCEAVMRFGR